jgi:hypothetical protein
MWEKMAFASASDDGNHAAFCDARRNTRLGGRIAPVFLEMASEQTRVMSAKRQGTKPLAVVRVGRRLEYINAE